MENDNENNNDIDRSIWILQCLDKAWLIVGDGPTKEDLNDYGFFPNPFRSEDDPS